ncbi:uncharacterized protein A1O9_08440 [Exophiala aquamarina CBS 119918]|uniref:Cylicin I n=1 Tax=Exophiala aquamarina CBS 119918 TaxID=1182545 RepID=A0A072PJJ6_9EURO|nr:uncharacterized protein A1O9_08440 [Exophiala aquamarina CBS 119918]KEF55690.1 hypothetical protein A1O9_08440 [Exophiala aquamarina CBS 119918]
MALPRSSALRSTIRSFTIKRAGTQARINLRSIARRTYASGHEAKKGSDIPWLIGSVAATVPAAVWLWQQGPEPSAHGHGHESHGKEEEAPQEEPEDKPEEEESKGDESSDDSKAESDDDGKSETSGEGDSAGSAKKDAKVSEKKGDKDAASDTTGAKHPVLDEKTKKGEGVADTAKIHGTVDSARPVGGKKEGSDKDQSEEDGDSDSDKKED